MSEPAVTLRVEGAAYVAGRVSQFLLRRGLNDEHEILLDDLRPRLNIRDAVSLTMGGWLSSVVPEVARDAAIRSKNGVGTQLELPSTKAVRRLMLDNEPGAWEAGVLPDDAFGLPAVPWVDDVLREMVTEAVDQSGARLQLHDVRLVGYLVEWGLWGSIEPAVSVGAEVRAVVERAVKGLERWGDGVYEYLAPSHRKKPWGREEHGRWTVSVHRRISGIEEVVDRFFLLFVPVYCADESTVPAFLRVMRKGM